MFRNLAMALIFITLLLTSSILLAEADFAVRNKIIEFITYEITTNISLVPENTDGIDASDNLIELRKMGYLMKPKKLGAVSLSMKNEMISKLNKLKMQYSVKNIKVTAEQISKKELLDGKYWTKSQVVKAGMPIP